MQARLSILALLTLTVVLAACGRVLTQPTAQPTATPPLATVALAGATPRPTTAVVPLPTDPPPTPRPTATPVIHVVEPGDTLLGIAGRFQVTVDEITLANPDLRPQFLQIGQRINIPAGSEELSGPSLLPVPTPLPLAIAGFRLYHTPAGGLWALGEVINDTVSPVEEVQVAVNLYDAAGELSATAKAWAARDVTHPGESAPFGVLFSPPPADVANQQVTVLHAVPAARASSRYADVIVTQHQGGPAGSVYRVTGMVSNGGDQTAKEIKVLVTLYDSASQVTGFRQVTLSNPLPPGSTTRFDVWLSPSAPGIDHYSVYASGRRPDPTE
jgi:LysM repeat protein